jgi:hypothetical protein
MLRMFGVVRMLGVLRMIRMRRMLRLVPILGRPLLAALGEPRWATQGVLLQFHGEIVGVRPSSARAAAGLQPLIGVANPALGLAYDSVARILIAPVGKRTQS